MDVKQEVKAKELAEITGLSARRIQQMAKDGTLHPTKKSPLAFILDEAIQNYIAFMKLSTGDVELTKEAKDAKAKKMIYEAGIRRSQNEIQKLRLGELKGKLHRSEDVKMAFDDLVMTMRAGVLALPGRLAMNISKESDASVCSTMIRDECYRLLEDISRHSYDPEKYIKKAEERDREENNKK